MPKYQKFELDFIPSESSIIIKKLSIDQEGWKRREKMPDAYRKLAFKRILII